MTIVNLIELANMEIAERMRRPVRLTAVNPCRYHYAMTPKRDRHIPDLVSLREAAATLKMSKQAVHKRAMKGQLEGAQIDGAWVFRRTVVEAAKAVADEDE